MIYTNFDHVISSMLNWDVDNGKSISDTSSYIKDDILTMELEVPGLSNKDIEVNVEDRLLTIKAEKDSRKLEKTYKIHESFDLSATNAIAKDGLLNITIPKYEDRKAKNIKVTVK
jgi:HSP20 family molecular chaperone IbpA